jgi:hypothetical protein
MVIQSNSLLEETCQRIFVTKGWIGLDTFHVALQYTLIESKMFCEIIPNKLALTGKKGSNEALITE